MKKIIALYVLTALTLFGYSQQLSLLPAVSSSDSLRQSDITVVVHLGQTSKVSIQQLRNDFRGITGATGPTGLTGSQGAQGVTGPTGGFSDTLANPLVLDSPATFMAPIKYAGVLYAAPTAPAAHVLSLDSVGNMIIDTGCVALTTCDTATKIATQHLLDSLYGNAWNLNGNSISSGQFLGTINAQPLNIKTNNTIKLDVTTAGHFLYNGAPDFATYTSLGNSLQQTGNSVGDTLTDFVDTLLPLGPFAAFGPIYGCVLNGHDGTNQIFIPVSRNVSALGDSIPDAMQNHAGYYIRTMDAGGNFNIAAGTASEQYFGIHVPTIGDLKTIWSANYFKLTGASPENNFYFDPNTGYVGIDLNADTINAAFQLNINQHNNSHPALDIYQTEYNLHTFTISPKGTTVINQDEDYGGHPSALAVTAAGSGSSTNAAFVVTQNGASGNAAATFNGGNVGVGTTSPVSLLSVGSGNQFQVNSNGNLSYVNNVNYNWPSGNGNGALVNDGSGNLNWTTVSGWSLIGNTGTTSGTSTLGTNDNASLNISTADTNRLTVDSLGNVWIGYVNGPQLPGVYGFNVDGPTALYGGIENNSSGLTIASNSDSNSITMSHTSIPPPGNFNMFFSSDLFNFQSTDHASNPLTINTSANLIPQVGVNGKLQYRDAAGTYTNTGYVATTDGNGNISYINTTASQVNDTLITPSSGGSFVCANGQTAVICIGSGTATTFTITLPPTPNDGFRFYYVSATAVITALTFSTSDGSVFATTNPFSVASGKEGFLIYHASTNSWY